MMISASLPVNFLTPASIANIAPINSANSNGQLFSETKPEATVPRPVLPSEKTGSVSATVSSDETKSENAQQSSGSANERLKKKQLELKEKQDAAVIEQLAARDREVRAHEQAHANVGGQYAGAPTYQFQRGPDGVSYAVGGEVSIDVSPAATPEETIRKMQVVRAAALAPAEPSAQDRRVAAQAAATQAQAQSELAIDKSSESNSQTATQNKPDNSESARDENARAESQDEAFYATSFSQVRNTYAAVQNNDVNESSGRLFSRQV